MIDLYYWTTPNGHKITMFLEETGLPYKIIPIHIGKGEQFQPDFLKVDHKKREEAIKRGEEFADKLTEREKAEAAAAEAALHPGKKKDPAGLIENLAKLASIAFSIFSLIGVIIGAITQVDKMNGIAGNFDKIWIVIEHYPIPVAIAVFVIGSIG